MTGLKGAMAVLAARGRSDAATRPPARLREVARFGDNPGALRMLMHAPATPAAKAALVVVLHGCTQTAEGYARGAGWLDLADRYGFAVLCPEQTRANNPNLCFNWFQPEDVARGAGEAASIRAMIAHAIADNDLDPRRVFVTGLSAGGAMANVMLATYPETFVGGAIIAGLPYGAASNMQQALGAMRNATSLPALAWGDAVRAASAYGGPWPSVSIWQGDSDATVLPGVADELVRQWTDVHGLDAAAGEVVARDARRRHTVWRGPGGRPLVELHRITGMGHGVALGCDLAEGCGAAGPYMLEVGIASSLEIARDWRLLDEAGDKARGEAAPLRPSGLAPGAGASAASQTAHLRPAAALDVGAVITDALRAARLLK